jgi:hypothetical protein
VYLSLHSGRLAHTTKQLGRSASAGSLASGVSDQLLHMVLLGPSVDKTDPTDR